MTEGLYTREQERIGLQPAVGYSVGFLANFFGTVFTGGSFEAVWASIVVSTAVAAIAAVITLLNFNRTNQPDGSYTRAGAEE